MQVQTSCLSVRPKLEEAFRQQARPIFLHRNMGQQSVLVLVSIGTNSTVGPPSGGTPHQWGECTQKTTIQRRRARVPVETNVGERFNDIIHQMMRS
jgi:hypothetical protein